MINYYIRTENESKKLFLSENFGVHQIKLKNPEEIDETISNIVNRDLKKQYRFFISSQTASFSNDICTKYASNKNIRIVIS